MKREIFHAQIATAQQYQTAEGYSTALKLLKNPELSQLTTAQAAEIFNLSHASIADLRKKAGETQSTFAQKIGAPVTTVRNWEQRDQCATYIRLMIAEIFGLIKIPLE